MIIFINIWGKYNLSCVIQIKTYDINHDKSLSFFFTSIACFSLFFPYKLVLLVPKKNMTKASCLHENIQLVGWTISYKGLPWESIGQASTFQCREWRLYPWSENQDPICHGATKSFQHNFWAQMSLEPTPQLKRRSCVPQLRPDTSRTKKEINKNIKQSIKHGILRHLHTKTVLSPLSTHSGCCHIPVSKLRSSFQLRWWWRS